MFTKFPKLIKIAMYLFALLINESKVVRFLITHPKITTFNKW